MNRGKWALLRATLTPSGLLLSNVHFEVVYIGSENAVWKKFYEYAYQLENVDIMDPPSVMTARGIDPEYGFEIVYRTQRIS